MPDDQLPTRGVGNTDLIEEQSRQILRSKLPLSDALVSNYDGKYPNIDGHIEFLGPNGSTAVRMLFSLKGTANDISHHNCEREFLNYCQQAAEPCFLILVNIPRDRVYWVHIDPAYISSELGIPDLATFAQQTKRINFLESQVIDNNAAELIELCKQHYRDNAARFTGTPTAAVATPERIEEAAAVPLEDVPDNRPFADVEAKFAPAIEGLDERMILYHAFVYSLRPFYMDTRNDARRSALLTYLGITDSEERYIIETLIRQGLLDRTGELLSVTDRSDALSSFSHYLDNDRIDLEEVSRISAL